MVSVLIVFLIMFLNFSVPPEDVIQLTDSLYIHSRYSEVLFSHFPFLDPLVLCHAPMPQSQITFRCQSCPHPQYGYQIGLSKVPREATTVGF